jgi:methylglutaconyl-CoA hydratase
MRRAAAASLDDNRNDAMALAALMRTLAELRKPTIARVQGAAYGGGVGLVACCDIAVAVTGAAFALSEAKLGLVPAVISPYVVAAIGQRAARRYFITAERFDSAEAWRLGLVPATRRRWTRRSTTSSTPCSPAARSRRRRPRPWSATWPDAP